MSKFCRYKIEEQLFPTETYPHENLSLSLEAKLFQDESMLTWLVGGSDVMDKKSSVRSVATT